MNFEPSEKSKHTFSNLNKGLKIYIFDKDIDKDKVPNIKDCAPLDPNRHGIGTWIRAKVKGTPYIVEKEKEQVAKITAKAEKERYAEIERETYRKSYEEAKEKALKKRGKERAEARIKQEFIPRSFGGFDFGKVGKAVSPIASYFHGVAEASGYGVKPIKKVKKVKIKQIGQLSQPRIISPMESLGMYAMGIKPIIKKVKVRKRRRVKRRRRIGHRTKGKRIVYKCI